MLPAQKHRQHRLPDIFRSPSGTLREAALFDISAPDAVLDTISDAQMLSTPRKFPFRVAAKSGGMVASRTISFLKGCP